MSTMRTMLGVAVVVFLATCGMAQAGLYVNFDINTYGSVVSPTYSGQGAYATPGNYWNADSTPGSNKDSAGTAVGVNCYVDFVVSGQGGSYNAGSGGYVYSRNDLLCDFYYSPAGIRTSITGLTAGKLYDVTVYGASPTDAKGDGSLFTLETGTASTTSLNCTGLHADWTQFYVPGVSYVTFHNVAPVSYSYLESTSLGIQVRSDVLNSSNSYFLGMQVAETVPEPATAGLLGMVVVSGLLCYAWRKRR